MKKIILLIIIILVSLSSARKRTCRGLDFKEDPFNKDRKESKIVFSVKDHLMGANIGIVYDDNRTHLTVEISEQITNSKATKIPIGTPIRIALDNDEQIVLSTDYDVFPTEAMNMYYLWRLEFEVTQDIVAMLADSQITGTQLKANNRVYTMLPPHEFYTKHLSKVCNCFSSDEFWEESSQKSSESKNNNEKKKKRKHNNSDI